MRKLIWISAIFPATSILIAGCGTQHTGKPVLVDQSVGVPISKTSSVEQPRVDAQQPASTQSTSAPPTPQFVEPPKPETQASAPPQPVLPQRVTPARVSDVSPALINPTGAPAVAPAELAANATVDQVLDALDQRGESMREFTAKVSLTDGEEIQGDVSTRTGRMWFQKKDDDGRLRVTFDKRIDGKIIRNEKTEFLLDKGWLLDRDYRKNTQSNRQVVKPGEKMNLLKLGEGPFPLPIGQKKEDVHKLFEVTKVPQTAEETKDKDLANTIHLTLVPKPGTRFQRRFGAIDVWVDRKSNFPAQIHTQAPDESDPHTTKLQDLLINPAGGLKEGDFVLPEIDEQTWSLHTEPYRE